MACDRPVVETNRLLVVSAGRRWCNPSLAFGCEATDSGEWVNDSPSHEQIIINR